ncbi:efflux RND transporter periplasmic adaptor subunit [Alkaliphilus sp. MSJ-5]|uniref:Efflux RND transporter periplasmic adaptor subunit n=1 Tax=Alkaliphilus flagellatus TaxID=2841507 RepID=A0ABS6FZ84_9FIRM|nr:efflux RND transporter periplasmic adaptor subunit [Alkaliphilus flagellatus]MBU5675378.1 efflux RND transporter periplasmic adaptor subunit [Alkaliphilus flagellatus]
MEKKMDALLKYTIMLIMINIILSGCQMKVSDNREKEVAVEVMEVKKKSISKNVVLNTYLQPKKNAIILAKTPGLTVTNIGVNIGDAVTEGDFLFELDKSIIRTQIEQSKQAYDLARRNYEEQKNRYEEANDTNEENSLQALEAMYRNKAIGGLQIPSIPQQDKGSILAVAMNQVEQARMAYSAALSQLKEMEYYSPISGYVSQININENQPVLGTQAAMVITNIENLKASVNISKSLFESLKEGQMVMVNVDDTEFNGRISNLSPIPDLSSNLYLLEIEINNKDKKSWVGAFSNILIELDKKDSATVIPKSAILEDSKGKYVFVEQNNRVYRRKVDIGIDDGGDVEVVNGLNEGEKIVIKGQQFVKDRGAVIIVRGEENENL